METQSPWETGKRLALGSSQRVRGPSQSAIYANILSADVAVPLTREEGHEFADLTGTSHPADRNVARYIFDFFGFVLSQKRLGCNIARSDCIHQNALIGDLLPNSWTDFRLV